MQIVGQFLAEYQVGKWCWK